MFTGQIKWLTKYKYRRTAVVAEWLRRLTRNQFPSGSVGSNPTDCEIFSALVIYVVEVKSSISISWQRTTASLAMAINFVLMCFLGQNIFNLVGLRQEFNIASIVGSVVECSPATRAARVRFPDDANIFFVSFPLSQISNSQLGLTLQFMCTFLFFLLILTRVCFFLFPLKQYRGSGKPLWCWKQRAFSTVISSWAPRKN